MGEGGVGGPRPRGGGRGGVGFSGSKPVTFFAKFMRGFMIMSWTTKPTRSMSGYEVIQAMKAPGNPARSTMLIMVMRKPMMVVTMRSIMSTVTK